MLRYKVPKLVFDSWLKPVTPKWISNFITRLFILTWLGTLIYINRNPSDKMCALWARSMLSISYMFADSKNFVVILILLREWVTKLNKSIPIPFKQVFRMSHLPFFEIEIYIKFLIWSCDDHKLRFDLRKYFST